MKTIMQEHESDKHLQKQNKSSKVHGLVHLMAPRFQESLESGVKIRYFWSYSALDF